MATVEQVKEQIVEEVRRLHPRLIEISHEIHDNPEIGFQEHRAAALLTDELERNGFSVERGMAGMETAFIGSWGKGKPMVGFLAEYDALRGIGRVVNPVLYTQAGDYDQDPALQLPLLPGLQPARQLAKLDPKSDEYGFLRTRAVRERNRMVDALHRATLEAGRLVKELS